jgi:hypothetical protein
MHRSAFLHKITLAARARGCRRGRKLRSAVFESYANMRACSLTINNHDYLIGACCSWRAAQRERDLLTTGVAIINRAADLLIHKYKIQRIGAGAGGTQQQTPPPVRIDIQPAQLRNNSRIRLRAIRVFRERAYNVHGVDDEPTNPRRVNQHAECASRNPLETITRALFK